MKLAKSTETSVDAAPAPSRYSSNALLTALAALGFCSLFLYHFYTVWTYSVNVPYRDEWDTLGPTGLSSEFSPQWIFGWHNEHRLATTRLLIWLLYKFNGWDLVIHQVLNFLFFGILLSALVLWSQQRAVRQPLWVAIGFTGFLLSPIIYENHLMGYQSQVHFALLFFVGATCFLFEDSQRWRSVLAGSAMATLSIYSLSSGIVTSSVVLASYVAFKLLRRRALTVPEARNRELGQTAVVAIIIGLAMALWFIGYHKPPNGPPNASLFSTIFWNYFLNIVAFGFGIEAVSPWRGLLCLAIVVVPVLGEFLRRRSQATAASWSVAVGIAGVLAVLAVISIGRAIGFGIEQSKSSRYAEIGMLLIPLSAMAWSLFLRDRPRLNALALSALWLFCFSTFFHTWAKFGVYQAQFTERTAGLECVERYYQGKGRGNCRALYPSPIPDKLARAKELNLSFYSALRAGTAERLENP